MTSVAWKEWMQMTMAQLADRLALLEKTVEDLKARLTESAGPRRRWWTEDAGRFANDPIFDEMVKLGSAYRNSLRPGQKKGKA